MQEIKDGIPLSQLVETYRARLGKSSNLIFCDTLGINEIFGNFLQIFNLNLANLVECAQFASRHLIFEAFQLDRGSNLGRTL